MSGPLLIFGAELYLLLALFSPDPYPHGFAFGDGPCDEVEVMQPPGIFHGGEQPGTVGVLGCHKEGLSGLEVTKGKHREN
jgi:hypothetical protein